MKEFLKKNLSPSIIEWIKYIRSLQWPFFQKGMYFYGRYIKTPISLYRNKNKSKRMLEIGPGAERIQGFETINVVWGLDVDYILDASKKLPFADGSFEVVYASHVLEHIPWYLLRKVVAEWARVISKNGYLEIWVPNGLLIAKTFVNAEEGIENLIFKDGWYKFNPEKDPCIWANGRIFSYGDGFGNKDSPNWHLTIFSPRFLNSLLEHGGFIDIEQLSHEEVRGYDHGWINLGIRGRKL